MVAALLLAPIPVRANVTTDIGTFLTTSTNAAPSLFATFRGKLKRKGEFYATRSFGSLSRCLVIDMPSLASLFDQTNDSDESDFECTSARVKMTQPQLLAWLERTIGRALGPAYTAKRYPALKRGDRASTHWTSGPIEVSAIVSGNADLADHDTSRNFFYISLSYKHTQQDGS